MNFIQSYHTKNDSLIGEKKNISSTPASSIFKVEVFSCMQIVFILGLS